MTSGYYLHDYPNPNFGQYGWPRAKLGQPGTKLSGVIGVHTTEAITDFEGVDNNAENNAAFVGRRTDPGGYHTTADADSIVHLVHPRYSAWADTTNNAHALSVSGALQAARWLEMTPARREAVVKNMAYAIAQIVTTAVDEGYLSAPVPARRITPAEAIAGTRAGFYGHGETNPGRRYDPGQNFDWTLFLSTYASAIGGGITAQGTITTQEEPLVPNESDKVFWSIEGSEKVSLNELLNSIDRKASAALAAIGGLLAVQLPDPSEPGKMYSVADFIVWSATNAKVAAGSAAVAASNTDPAALGKAVAAAAGAITAEDVAAQLVVTVKPK